MSTFEELMESNPPRLVVQFSRNPAGEETFTWGMVGNLQKMSLIGNVASAQHDLLAETYIAECPLPALVIVGGEPSHLFVDPDIPIDPLVGMLEVIKTYLVSALLASKLSGLVGPDGRPIQRT